MPRGVRKPVDVRLEMAKIDDQIKALQDQRKTLAKKKMEEDFVELQDFLREKDISETEALDMLTTAVAASQKTESIEV